MFYVHHWFNSAKEDSSKKKTAKLPHYQLVPGDLTATVAISDAMRGGIYAVRYYKRQ